MNEMIERLRGAVRAADQKYWGLEYEEWLEKLARAMVAAMREPTPDMIEAAELAQTKDYFAGKTASVHHEGRIWQAMTDRILEDGVSDTEKIKNALLDGAERMDAKIHR